MKPGAIYVVKECLHIKHHIATGAPHADIAAVFVTKAAVIGNGLAATKAVSVLEAMYRYKFEL